MDHASEEHSNEHEHLESVVSRVSERFPTVERERVEAVVDEEAAQLEDARVRDYIPVLVEHEAVDRLREEADPVSLAERQDSESFENDPALRGDDHSGNAPSAGPLLGGLRGGD